MKKIAALITCLAFFCTFVHAQQKKINQLSIAIEELRAAMVNPTAEQLNLLLSDSLSYGHSSGHIDTKQQFIEKLTSGKSDFVSIDITEQTIQVFKNTGIVRHNLSAVTNDNGKQGNVKLHVLTIWIKDGSAWKLTARQAVKLT